MISKYGAKKTVVDGIRFDSKAEANRYKELQLLKRAGEVVDLELQPTFIVIPSYTDPLTGGKVRATKYRADFKITYRDGRVEYEDVKGMITKDYRLKKKLVESQYGIPIREVRYP